MTEKVLRCGVVETVAFLDIDDVIPYFPINIAYNLLVY